MYRYKVDLCTVQKVGAPIQLGEGIRMQYVRDAPKNWYFRKPVRADLHIYACHSGRAYVWPRQALLLVSRGDHAVFIVELERSTDFTPDYDYGYYPAYSLVLMRYGSFDEYQYECDPSLKSRHPSLNVWGAQSLLGIHNTLSSAIKEATEVLTQGEIKKFHFQQRSVRAVFRVSWLQRFIRMLTRRDG